MSILRKKKKHANKQFMYLKELTNKLDPKKERNNKCQSRNRDYKYRKDNKT